MIGAFESATACIIDSLEGCETSIMNKYASRQEEVLQT
jgi:hypothetical protein